MSSMFGQILFPVDFSPRCAETAVQVAAIARKFRSKVTLIHAIGDYTNVFTPDAPSSFAWREWLLKDAEPQIAFFGKPLLDQFVVERVVDDGEPADVITRYAASHPVDLITLPTHGRGLFRRLLPAARHTLRKEESCKSKFNPCAGKHRARDASP